MQVKKWDKIEAVRLYSVFQVTHCNGLLLLDNEKGDDECGEIVLSSQ